MAEFSYYLLKALYEQPLIRKYWAKSLNTIMARINSVENFLNQSKSSWYGEDKTTGVYYGKPELSSFPHMRITWKDAPSRSYLRDRIDMLRQIGGAPAFPWVYTPSKDDYENATHHCGIDTRQLLELLQAIGRIISSSSLQMQYVKITASFDSSGVYAGNTFKLSPARDPAWYGHENDSLFYGGGVFIEGGWQASTGQITVDHTTESWRWHLYLAQYVPNPDTYTYVVEERHKPGTWDRGSTGGVDVSINGNPGVSPSFTLLAKVFGTGGVSTGALDWVEESATSHLWYSGAIDSTEDTENFEYEGVYSFNVNGYAKIDSGVIREKVTSYNYLPYVNNPRVSPIIEPVYSYDGDLDWPGIEEFKTVFDTHLIDTPVSVIMRSADTRPTTLEEYYGAQRGNSGRFVWFTPEQSFTDLVNSSTRPEYVEDVLDKFETARDNAGKDDIKNMCESELSSVPEPALPGLAGSVTARVTHDPNLADTPWYKVGESGIGQFDFNASAVAYANMGTSDEMIFSGKPPASTSSSLWLAWKDFYKPYGWPAALRDDS